MQRVVTACAGSLDPRRLVYAIEARRSGRYGCRMPVRSTAHVDVVEDKAFLVRHSGPYRRAHDGRLANGVGIPRTLIFAAGRVVTRRRSRSSAVSAAAVRRCPGSSRQRCYRGHSTRRCRGPAQNHRAGATACGSTFGATCRRAGREVVPCSPRALATARARRLSDSRRSRDQEKALELPSAEPPRDRMLADGARRHRCACRRHLSLASTPEEWATQVAAATRRAARSAVADAGRETGSPRLRGRSHAAFKLHRFDYLFGQRAADYSRVRLAAATDKTLTAGRRSTRRSPRPPSSRPRMERTTRWALQIQRDALYVAAAQRNIGAIWKAALAFCGVVEPIGASVFRSPCSAYAGTLCAGRRLPVLLVHRVYCRFLALQDHCSQIRWNKVRRKSSLLSYRQVSLMDVFVAKALANCAVEAIVSAVVISAW